MERRVFITLPVVDVVRSRSFYQGLGFAIDDRFCDEMSACLVISNCIYVMLLAHPRFQDLSVRPMILPNDGASALITLSCASRAEVDQMNAAALALGGAEVHGAEDLGHMYSRAFADPDGHGFGIMWIDPTE
jgi:uncharacterized protein